MKTFLLAFLLVFSINTGYQMYLSYGAIYCRSIDDIPYKLLGFKLGCKLSNFLENK